MVTAASLGRGDSFESATSNMVDLSAGDILVPETPPNGLVIPLDDDEPITISEEDEWSKVVQLD